MVERRSRGWATLQPPYLCQNRDEPGNFFARPLGRKTSEAPYLRGKVQSNVGNCSRRHLRPQKYGGGHLPTYGKCLRPRRKETLTGIYLLAEMATRKKRKANDDNNTSTPAEIWRRASTYLRGMTTPEEEGDADGHLPNWKWQRTRCYLVLVVVVVVAVVGSSNNDQTMLCPFLIYPIPHISLEFG